MGLGLSFRVAPGVRLRASSRGLSAGLGPRAARVHVGTYGVGVSSGAGPVTAYSGVGGGSRRSSSGRRVSYGPTKAQIAAYERELKAAQREADIEKVRYLEDSLIKVHQQSFLAAKRVELPPIEEVDQAPIRERLEKEAGIPSLVPELGDGDDPPIAAEPEPVDRYMLMREHRKRESQGIGLLKIRDRIAAAQRGDEAAEVAALEEEERREAAQVAEQQRLDALWQQLLEARSKVAELLPNEVEAERKRREKARDTEQAELNAEWQKLLENEPITTMALLEAAFADNESPAAPIDCQGDATTVVMQFPQPEEIVPERKPARTPTGKPTLKKRNKTETNQLYVEALASNVLATIKEAFAVAPGTKTVRILVVRREIEKKLAGQLAVIFIGGFDRESMPSVSATGLRGVIENAEEAELNLKGKTELVSAINLKDRSDVEGVLEEISQGLK